MSIACTQAVPNPSPAPTWQQVVPPQVRMRLQLQALALPEHFGGRYSAPRAAHLQHRRSERVGMLEGIGTWNLSGMQLVWGRRAAIWCVALECTQAERKASFGVRAHAGTNVAGGRVAAAVLLAAAAAPLGSAMHMASLPT